MVEAYFFCQGDVRGECGHKHKSYEAARKCLERDRSGCASQGGYSDMEIYYTDENGTIIYESDYDDE